MAVLQISRAILTAIKRSLKTSAKTIIKKQVGIDVNDIEKLFKLADKPMSDLDAVLFNRAKTASSTALKKTIADQTGLSSKTINSLIKNFNQTEKMAKISKNKLYKKALSSASPEPIKNKTQKIEMLEREATKKKPQKRDLNKEVYNELAAIQDEFIYKIQGAKGVTNKRKMGIKFDLDIMKYFKPDIEYTIRDLHLLHKMYDKLQADIMFYDGGETDVAIVYDGEWQVNSKKSTNLFVRNFKSTIRVILGRPANG